MSITDLRRMGGGEHFAAQRARPDARSGPGHGPSIGLTRGGAKPPRATETISMMICSSSKPNDRLLAMAAYCARLSAPQPPTAHGQHERQQKRFQLLRTWPLAVCKWPSMPTYCTSTSAWPTASSASRSRPSRLARACCFGVWPLQMSPVSISGPDIGCVCSLC